VWTATAIGTLRFAWLLPGLVLTGISIALVTTPASTDAMNTAPRAWRGQAQGVIQTLRHMGGTVGLAIMGTVVASIQRARLAAFASQTSASTAGRTNVTAILSAAHGDRAMLKSLSAGTLGALRDSLAAGIGGALCISGAVVLAGAIAAWTLLRRVPAADASVMPPQAARLGPDTSWNQDGSRGLREDDRSGLAQRAGHRAAARPGSW